MCQILLYTILTNYFYSDSLGGPLSLVDTSFWLTWQEGVIIKFSDNIEMTSHIRIWINKAVSHREVSARSVVNTAWAPNSDRDIMTKLLWKDPRDSRRKLCSRSLIGWTAQCRLLTGPEDAPDDELHHPGGGGRQQLLLLEGEVGGEAGPGGGGGGTRQRWVQSLRCILQRCEMSCPVLGIERDWGKRRIQQIRQCLGRGSIKSVYVFSLHWRQDGEGGQ